MSAQSLTTQFSLPKFLHNRYHSGKFVCHCLGFLGTSCRDASGGAQWFGGEIFVDFSRFEEGAVSEISHDFGEFIEI